MTISMVRTVASAIAVAAFAAVVVTQPVRAQDAARLAVPAPIDCAKPGEPPKPGAANADVARFQKRLDEYKTCVDTYAKVNAGKAQEYQAQSRVYADAANSAVDDFNAYVNELNAKRLEAAPKK